MKQSLHSTLACLAGLALAALLCGCAWSIGSKDGETCPSTMKPTKGAELLDLKRAYDQGVITEQEYQDQKARVLDEE